MRRFPAIGALILTGLVWATTASAQEETQRAPYADATHKVEASCAAGATCFGWASADVGGQVLARSVYDRASVVEGEESQRASGVITARHRVGPGVRSVTATFTWLVTGSVRAGSRTGLVEAALEVLAGTADCGPACRVSSSSSTVLTASDGSAPRLVTRLRNALDPPRLSVTDEPVSVTVSATGLLPRWLTVSSTAVALTGGGPSAGCTAGPPPSCRQDWGHAGAAAAELDARLQWVAFDES